MPRDEVEMGDYYFLLRAPAFDAMFPADQMVSTLQQTLSGLGMSLDSQPNLRLDIEPRPLKSPRAFCAPIRIPEEVMLVIKPQGGQRDYSALLHEAGHAEHFASVDPSVPFAFRYLGEKAVSETYAFLFQHLMHDGSWLDGVLGHPGVEYRRFALFAKLFLIRRYAAKLVYELEYLHFAGPSSEAQQAYTRLLGNALKIGIFPGRFLDDVDDGFYAADYLRAWIFEMQLSSHLKREFGAAWWNSPSAGEFLQSLWEIGSRDSVDDLALQIGYTELDTGFLVREFEAALAP
jgi:hypothetical protein